MVFDFSGKNAVITGGAHGIGFETARILRDGGARVVVFDREPAEGRRDVDVSDPTALEAAFDEAPPPDIVIANAGIGDQAGLTETPRELWDRTVAVNLSGVFHTVRAAAKRMKTRGSGGSIVITASTNSFDGEANLIAYNASKAGLLGILHTAANELGPHGIRVNAVCPGLIRTRLTAGHFAQPELLKDYFRAIPLGRGGEPHEVAQAIAFLASDLASYITGAALMVDGGQMCCKFATWDESMARFQEGRWILTSDAAHSM